MKRPPRRWSDPVYRPHPAKRPSERLIPRRSCCWQCVHRVIASIEWVAHSSRDLRFHLSLVPEASGDAHGTYLRSRVRASHRTPYIVTPRPCTRAGRWPNVHEPADEASYSRRWIEDCADTCVPTLATSPTTTRSLNWMARRRLQVGPGAQRRPSQTRIHGMCTVRTRVATRVAAGRPNVRRLASTRCDAGGSSGGVAQSRAAVVVNEGLAAFDQNQYAKALKAFNTAEGEPPTRAAPPSAPVRSQLSRKAAAGNPSTACSSAQPGPPTGGDRGA